LTAPYTDRAVIDDLSARALMERIAYRFSNPELLDRALTHRSWAHDQTPPGADNERLEFLGDAVLGLVVAEHLVARYPHDEGHLTRARAALVRRDHLAALARRLELGRWLKLGRGEESSGGREKDSILADAFEALLGAIYRDGGLEAAAGFLLHAFGGTFEPEGEDGELLSPRDACTQLQERLQSEGEPSPRYHLLGGDGPPHDPRWNMEVRVGERVLGAGWGRSKQEARREAARLALDALDDEAGA
jgi:ribonuclease-3